MTKSISNILESKIEDINRLKSMVEVLHIVLNPPKTVNPASTTGNKDYKKMYGIKS